MREQLKADINETTATIENIKDAIDDKSTNFSDSSKILWQRGKEKLSDAIEKLNDASEKLHHTTDEAILQAHLAAMEAHDIWVKSRDSIESLGKSTIREVKTEMDHAALQGHLARMEAEDFMEAQGKDIVHGFTSSRSKVERSTSMAIKELKENVNEINKGLYK